MDEAFERCRSEVPQLIADGTGHATACHRMAELPAPDSIVPSDGGFSPVLVLGLTGPLLRSPEQGADTIVWLGAAAEPGESSGGFWHDRRRRPTHRLPWTRETSEDRERLWSECERLTGWHAVPVPAPTHAHP